MLNEISVEIIRKCPNNCLHCSSISNCKREEIMPISKFKEIVNDAKALGAKVICLSGGEPFIHPDIIDMIKYVYENNLESYVYTSGIAFDKHGNYSSIPLSILDEISSYVTKLIFNIEAGTEETYNRIMGTKGCYKKMQQSIIAANERNILTEAHFVPMKLNLYEIDKVIELCCNYGVSKLSFLRLVVHGRAKENENVIALSNEENIILKNKLEEIENNTEISIRIGVPLSDGDSCKKCEAANGKLNIRYDGFVFPCEVFKNYHFKYSMPNLIADNVYSSNLIDIYKNSAYLKCVREISHNHTKSGCVEPCIGQKLINIEIENLEELK